jgi:hypothetical protein
MKEKIEQLLSQLTSTQQELAQLLSSMAGDQDWRSAGDEWSFRYIAAHLATSEKECFLERILRISIGGKPFLAYYDNADSDFSQHDLLESLKAWSETRQAIIEAVRGLSDDQLILTGKHETMGDMSVQQLLQLMVDHDQEHIRNLRKLIKQHKSQ